MNIIDIFNRKNRKKEPLYASFGSENKASTASKNDPELLDVPTVLFEDLELQATIGHWLGVLSSPQSSECPDYFYLIGFKAEDLAENDIISTRQLHEIEKKFGYLLKLTGVPSSEICYLSQHNREDASFHCSLVTQDKEAKISLRWGDMTGLDSELEIQSKNQCNTYNYIPGSMSKLDRLNLRNYTIQNPENGNSCFRFLSSDEAFFTLQNEEYSLSIDVCKPVSGKISSSSTFAFRLNNEKELHKYLLGLSFPVSIDEVYKKISEISTGSISKYPSFEIKIKSKKDNKMTDVISLRNGKLRKFIITKDGKTIEIDGEGNWSYHSPEYMISQGNQESAKDVNSAKNAPSSEAYSQIIQEVEKVKTYTKSLLSDQ